MVIRLNRIRGKLRYERKLTTMKARKYQSEEIDEIFESISPVEIEQSKIKMQISVKIEEIMKLKGISKSELANKANKQPSVITKWLSGSQNFTLDILNEVAFALGVKISAFFDLQPIQVIYKTNLFVHSKKNIQFEALTEISNQLIPTYSSTYYA